MSKFIIKEVYMVGKLSEKLSSETHCSICRNHLEDNSIYDNDCKNTYCNKSENSIEKGKCNHIFHTECIRRWLTTNIRCPNCFTKWESFKK